VVATNTRRSATTGRGRAFADHALCRVEQEDAVGRCGHEQPRGRHDRRGAHRASHAAAPRHLAGRGVELEDHAVFGAGVQRLAVEAERGLHA
jgi:hypothetical protein